jgi:hydroxybutyrate-dimer hydrolase
VKKPSAPSKSRQLSLVTATALFALAGCGGSNGSDPAPAAPAPAPAPVAVNTLPTGVTQHSVNYYSATSTDTKTAEGQDLLTGGLGRAGLPSTAPAALTTFGDAANPTALELRRNAIQANYRGLVDTTPGGGYGSLYGPNVAADGTVTTGTGLIPGREYFASYEAGYSGNRSVMAIQIPDSFDTANPCIVLGPASGSRGVYGAIGTSAEWGLKRGCAVALTDTGKGPGYHDLTNDTVNRVDGPTVTRTAAGALANFAANLTDTARAAFNAVLPNRFAVKHLHSQQNPEKDWGSHTLAATRYAFYAINDRFGTAATPVRFTPANTVVIAGSVSNGGAAVLRATELDTEGLIDGTVAAEPVTEMPAQTGYNVVFAGSPVASQGRHLADYMTYANIYQPCAGRALTEASQLNYINFLETVLLPGSAPRYDARCASLAAKGLVTGATVAEQAADALVKLRAYGWTPEANELHNSHWATTATPLVAMSYTLAYGRFAVDERVCGTSVAASNGATGDVTAPVAAAKAVSFATGNGLPSGAPAALIYDDSQGGAKQYTFGVSPSTGTADLSLDQALCHRSLVTGADPVTNAPLTGTLLAQSNRVRAGMAETTVNGNLRGVPSIMVAGRSDALIPVNHNARAYAAFNRTKEGSNSKLRYIEVTNAQHFDAFLPFSGYDNRFVPLHVYFNRAMDAMYAHLKNGTALPTSQVVATTPRGGTPGTGTAPALTAANVPAFSAAPGAREITFGSTSVSVPN